jgi:uncharacterized membrane protein YfcA
MTKDIILFLVGIVVGGMNAIAGGGMLLGFPVLLAFGLPALVANATSNIIVLPGQLASAFGYRSYLRKVPRSYIFLLVPCAVGGVIGATVLRHTSYGGFEKLVPWLIVFAILLFIAQPFLHFHLNRHMKRKATAKRPPIWLFFAILPLAIYGGYFGAGLGFVLLAFLGFTDLKDIHKMNALKNLAAAVICIVSIACLYSTHLIDWRRGLFMAAGNLIGGYFGAVTAKKISSHSVRIVVIVLGICTAAYLIVHQQ